MPVVVEVLARPGVLDGGRLDALRTCHHPHVTNDLGEVVGEISPEFTLHSGGASGEGIHFC